MIRLPFLVAGLIALGFLLILPTGGSAYITDFLFTLMIAFVLAQSWDWIGGEAGYINLAHYAFFGIGAYGFCLALVKGGMPIPVCFVIALVVTMVIAFVISFPLFRLRGDYFAFATLAMLPLAELLGLNFEFTGGADGVILPPKYVLFEAYYITIGLVVITVVITIWLNRIPFGYALKSIRNDEEAAEVCGVRIFPAKAKVLVLSSSIAALAGAVSGWKLSFIDPPTVFGLDVALIPIAMALLGGSGLLWGPIIGVLILGTLNQLLVVNLPYLQIAIFGLVLLLIGRFMPGGLLRSSVVRNSRIFGFLGREHHERVALAEVRSSDRLPLPEQTIDRDKVILDCRGVTMAFGGNVAVDNVNLKVHQGEIVGLVGTNGSGKTTLFNCISKVWEPKSGDIIFDGESLLTLRRDTVSAMGIGRTYQIPRPFEDLTVQENIAIPLMFRDGGAANLSEALSRATEFAIYAGLRDHLTTRADGLNLQQKKALEFARALAFRPKILLVDEVASGLTPTEVRTFVGHIREMRDKYGVTVIWVEHIFSALAQVVDRVVVMEQGSVIADGPLDEVVQDELVLKTYLGSSATDSA